MKQDLPLNYFEIIFKYLNQRIADNEDTKDFEFDKLMYNDVTFEFDVYEEAQLIRIRNLNTKQLYNITIHDGPYDYTAHETIQSLLDYIESEVVFTLEDWFEFCLNGQPIYGGQLFDIYQPTNRKDYIVQLKSGQGGFTYSKGSGTILKDIKYLGKSSESGYNITPTVGEPVNWCEDNDINEHNTLLYLMNAEHTLAALREPSLTVTTPLIAHVKEVYVCGIRVNILDDGYIVFEYNNQQYQITSKGHLSVEDIKTEGQLKEGFYHNTLYTRFNTTSETNFAQGVINVLNQITELEITPHVK